MSTEITESSATAHDLNPLLIREEEEAAVIWAISFAVEASGMPAYKPILNGIIDRLSDPKRVK